MRLKSQFGNVLGPGAASGDQSVGEIAASYDWPVMERMRRDQRRLARRGKRTIGRGGGWRPAVDGRAGSGDPRNAERPAHNKGTPRFDRRRPAQQVDARRSDAPCIGSPRDCRMWPQATRPMGRTTPPPRKRRATRLRWTMRLSYSAARSVCPRFSDDLNAAADACVPWFGAPFGQ